MIIGGVAGRLHGDPTPTYDLDTTPDPEPENLTRLAAALGDMHAGLRVPDVKEPVGFGFDASSIARFTSMATRGQLATNAITDNAYGVKISHQHSNVTLD